MKQATHEISIKTNGRGLVNINEAIVFWTHEQGMTTGLLTVFIRHTSSSLVIQENADPEVQRDLERFFARLVPHGDPIFRHVCEMNVVEFNEQAFSHLIEHWYRRHNLKYSGCHPRDLIGHITDMARFFDKEPVMNRDTIDQACENYFVEP